MSHQALLNRLKISVDGMGLNRVQFGFPDMVIKEVRKAEALFKDFSKAKPSSQDAYQAALKLLRGEKLDEWGSDLVAAAVSIPIKEQRGRTVLESEYCDDLLRKYENDAHTGDLWRPTWYSLLNSYLTYNLARTSTEAGMAGFGKLRRLLIDTWPSIDKQSGTIAVPDWVRILREENQLLSDNPVEKYARDYLAGNTDHIKALAENLGIPASSWFWQELVLGAVRHATSGNDDIFRSQILMLIELVKTAPVYRDKAIAEILNRYYKCSITTVHPELRDFVIHASVWKNPKLKAAGIATAWNQVSEAVWRMVMGWVNERNLRDFFDILAARRHADHGRLKFWSRYMNQISWTRLVFGSETIWQRNHNAGVRALLESEEGAFATLQGNTDGELDAFLMKIGNYIFVEFSKTGNGAYFYEVSDTRLDQNAPTYRGTTADLKSGYYPNRTPHIRHTGGWEYTAELKLMELGIKPDRFTTHQEPDRSKLSSEQAITLRKIGDLSQGAALIASEPIPGSTNKDTSSNVEYTIPVATSSFNWPSPANKKKSTVSVDQVRGVVSQYQGAQVTEKGSGLTRRIWVTNPMGWSALENELKKMEFQWAPSRQGWYLAED
jgi:hypothetical protein